MPLARLVEEDSCGDSGSTLLLILRAIRLRTLVESR